MAPREAAEEGGLAAAPQRALLLPECGCSRAENFSFCPWKPLQKRKVQMTKKRYLFLDKILTTYDLYVYTYRLTHTTYI